MGARGTAGGEHVIGVDVGTEGVRVGVFRLDGMPVVFAAEPYGVRHPHPGWAEQDPEVWWSALVAATRRALAGAGVPPESIRALSAGATSCSVVALDRFDRPLRPAIIWMDVRAVEEAREVAALDHPNRRVDGGVGVSAEWFPCKTLWLKRNEAELWSQSAHVVECIDWLMHGLTGEWTGSITAGAIRAYYDRTRGGWPDELYDALGLGELMEKVPRDVRDLGTPVGTLLPAVADELGLSRATLVTQGGVDAFVAQIGLGVLEPGRTALITGSSHLQLGQSAEEVSGTGFFGGYADAVVPGQWTVEGGQVSTGSVVHWFVERFGAGFAAEAHQRDVSIYDVLNERAEAIPIGSDGLVVLEYWQGNRTPYVDPEARGTIWGLTLAHRPEHVYRAILEGVCYGTAHTLRTMAEAGAPATHLVACGGAVASRMWMQMHADVTGLPVTLTRVQEAASLGPAILAAAGAGLFPSVSDATRAMVHERDTLEPDAERHAEYAFFLERYVRAYPCIRELVHDVARHVRRRGGAGAVTAGRPHEGP